MHANRALHFFLSLFEISIDSFRKNSVNSQKSSPILSPITIFPSSKGASKYFSIGKFLASPPLYLTSSSPPSPFSFLYGLNKRPPPRWPQERPLQRKAPLLLTQHERARNPQGKESLENERVEKVRLFSPWVNFFLSLFSRGTTFLTKTGTGRKEIRGERKAF